MTKTSYILIDYENVQPRDEDFDLIPVTGWHVKVFLGPTQQANESLLKAAQRLGPDYEPINVLRPGPNALDFYVAYYLRRLAAHKGGLLHHLQRCRL